MKLICSEYIRPQLNTQYRATAIQQHTTSSCFYELVSLSTALINCDNGPADGGRAWVRPQELGVMSKWGLQAPMSAKSISSSSYSFLVLL